MYIFNLSYYFLFLIKTIELEFSEDFDDLSLPVLSVGLEYLARVFVAIECKLLSLTFLLKWTIRECYSRDQDNSSPRIYLIVKQNNFSLSPVSLVSSENMMISLLTLALILPLIPGGEEREGLGQ